ncbi:hypothetical protein ACFX13_024348 [Malus domestica]
MHTRTPGWRADNPLWLRVQSEPWAITDPYHIRIKNNAGETKGLLYTFAPWIPHSTSREQLPFQVPVVGAKLLRSPDRKPELADVTRKTSRIKSFNLSDALIYSYRMDLQANHKLYGTKSKDMKVDIVVFPFNTIFISNQNRNINCTKS